MTLILEHELELTLEPPPNASVLRRTLPMTLVDPVQLEAISNLLAPASLILNLALAWRLLTRRSEKVELTKQPVRVQEETQVVSAAHLDLTLKDYATKGDLRNTERRIDEKLAAQDLRRSADSNNLHKHVESTAANFHKRLNDISESLGDQIRRLPNEIFQMLRNIHGGPAGE